MTALDDDTPAAEAAAQAWVDGYVGRRRAVEGIDDETMACLVAARLATLLGDRDLADVWHIKARHRLYLAGHTTASAMALVHAVWPTVMHQAKPVADYYLGGE